LPFNLSTEVEDIVPASQEPVVPGVKIGLPSYLLQPAAFGAELVIAIDFV
jgi:hypothetical protein